jgi:hypothetical protein
MKPITLTLFIFLALTAYTQTIRRVNNNSGVTGVNVYTTAQAAHDAAAVNDILMIEPSNSTYGDLTLTKPLKIYGNGYFLTTNTELKADQRSSVLRYVVLKTGSSGSRFYGLEIQDLKNGEGNPYVAYEVNDIIIDRCRITSQIQISNPSFYNGSTSIGTENISNLLITRCYINGSIGLYPTSPTTISNVMISNNIISNLYASGIQNGAVINNTFIDYAGAPSERRLSNSVFTNNILTSPSSVNGGYVLSFANVTVSNNVSYSTHFAVANGNQNNVDVTSALVGTGSGISDDERYQIKTNSSLKTAGSGGIEVGAFGGATPYVISGIAAIPSIVNMNSTGIGSNSTPLSVTISVKSNN